VTGRPSSELLLEALRPLVAQLVDEELQRRERERERDEWLTVEEFAEQRKTTPGAVRQRALRGQIPGAVRDGRRWLIPADTTSDSATVSSDSTNRGERRANGPAPGTGGRSSHAR
jgi:hypothetical protein